MDGDYVPITCYELALTLADRAHITDNRDNSLLIYPPFNTDNGWSRRTPVVVVTIVSSAEEVQPQ